jgi:hypothetical protein
MEATFSSKTWVDFQRSTGRYFPEDALLHVQKCFRKFPTPERRTKLYTTVEISVSFPVSLIPILILSSHLCLSILHGIFPSLKFEIVTAVATNITVVRDVTPCSLVDCQTFRGRGMWGSIRPSSGSASVGLLRTPVTHPLPRPYISTTSSILSLRLCPENGRSTLLRYVG